MAETKDKIWKLSFDVSEKSLEKLRALETQLSKIEQSSGSLGSGKKINVDAGVAAAIKGEKQKIAAMKVGAREATKIAKERARIERSTAKDAVRSEKERMSAIRRAGKAAINSAKQRAREERRVELATLKTAQAAKKAANEAIRARKAFKSAFLSIGRGGSGGFGAMARNAAATALSFVALHRVIQKIGEAKDRYLRFDELTTATMTITHAGEEAFEHGSKGAERYRDALRDAANEVKVVASEMSDSALFWAKAGQTNSDTIVELSKVGTIFARANRDAANNVLDQAGANNILSDALQLFRKDTSTTEKATEAATELGDKMTAAANASNIVVEQLFDYSKKVAGLFKTGEVPDEEIMAIAASLASAGLKEESGVHVRRILTQLANGSVQNLLRKSGIEVTNEAGDIRSFGDIFGELQTVLKDQKPLERMAYLKELFGQRAISTAAALAGLNEEGLPGETSIQAILDKIKESEGLAKRNQEEYLKTTAGRVQALTSEWGNALDSVLEDSGIIQKILGGLENIDPVEIFGWMETVAVPALEKFGITMRDVVIPGVVMTAENISEWLSPAMSALSSLLGGTSSNAEGLADTMTTLVKLWIKWRIALLAIRGLRMIDWFADFARKAKAAATATTAIGTQTTASVASAKTAVGGLAGAFSVAGIAITAAIAAWGIYDAIMEPLRNAEKGIRDFKLKYGDNFEKLRAGKESTSTLSIKIRQAEKARFKESDFEASQLNDPVIKKMIRDGKAEVERLKNIQAEQVRDEYGGGKFSTYEDRKSAYGQSIYGQESDEFITGSTPGQLPTDAMEGFFAEQLEIYRGERESLEDERESALDKYESASARDRDVLKQNLDVIADRLKDNADSIDEYTANLYGVADAINQASEKSQADKAEEAIKKERAVKRGRSFHGGKTKELNPFATPLLSGLDTEGNRVINIALQKGNAAEYYKRSPESRSEFERQFKEQNPNVYNISFGDNSLTVTAKSDAAPKDIAREVQKEWWKIGERQRNDVERVLGITVPPEI